MAVKDALRAPPCTTPPRPASPGGPQQVGCRRGYRGVAVTDEVVRYQPFEHSEPPFDFLLLPSSFDIVGREAQSDLRRAGKVGQMKVAGQSRLPFRYRCREYRFGQSVGDGSAVYDLALPEVCGQPRHHFRLHQLLHLEGNARQGDDRLVALVNHMPGAVPCMF